MHQKYRSGEPRTNQSASGSGTGSENSGNQTGSDTENSGKPDSGENTASPESTANLVDETKTKLTEMNSLGWWLPIVYEEGYTTENTVVTVDGVDVTSALTKALANSHCSARRGRSASAVQKMPISTRRSL